jgi:hypothetical protein
MGYPRNGFLAARRAALIALSISLLTFKVSLASAAFATLAWTSPRDVGTSQVTAYDLRISTNAILGTDTLSWWNGATRIPMAAMKPKAPGSAESIVLAALVDGTKYYAMLRSADAMQNWSPFSNVASFTATLVTSVADGSNAPAVVLGSPRPTPTSGRTEMSLDLPNAMAVEASVFDAQGRLVRRIESGTLAAGTHILRWDGSLEAGGNAASGVYWIRVGAGSIDKRVKVVVVR